MREKWLVELAERSAKEKWTKYKIEIEVRKAAENAVFATRIKTKKSFNGLLTEGRLAADPDVRDHVPWLVTVRDQAWARDPVFLHKTLWGPSQVLVDLMRRQRNPAERRHVASAKAYLKYLQIPAPAVHIVRLLERA